MSIDNRIFVPAGARHRKPDDPNYALTKFKYKAGDQMPESQKTPHQIFLAHQHLIDEQYFFAEADDARWFWLEGYKGRLFLDTDGKTVMSYDRMALWIKGEQVDERGYGPSVVNSPPVKVHALQTHEPLETRLDALGEPPVLYRSRAAAEIAATDYNNKFHDEEPATVGEIEVRESFQHEVQQVLAGDPASAIDKHKPPEPTKDPYSHETLQRAYRMFEEGATYVAVMNATGLDRETAAWISDRQSARLGLPVDAKPVMIVEAKPEDEL